MVEDYRIDQIKEVIDSEEIYDAMVNRNSLLLETEGEATDYYTKKVSGDRCPAYDTDDQQANSNCYICKGTGFLTGYDRYRFRTETLEVSNSNSTITVSLTGINQYTGKDFVWGEIATGSLTGIAESDWVETGDMLRPAGSNSGPIGLKTIVARSTSDNIDTQYRLENSGWKNATMFKDDPFTAGTRFKIRVILSRASVSDATPQWGATLFQYRNSNVDPPKVLRDDHIERLVMSRDGIKIDANPPFWMGPIPEIDNGDLIYFQNISQLMIVDSNDAVKLGPTNQLVMQKFDGFALAVNDPLQDVVWEDST